MDSPSGLTLRLAYLKCHRLTVRHHWPAGYPLSLSPTVQTRDRTVGTVLAIFDRIEAADRGDVRGWQDSETRGIVSRIEQNVEGIIRVRRLA